MDASLVIRRCLAPAGVVAATLALAACGGNSSSSTLPCGAPQGQVALVYPASGSTGIPDNVAGIIFGSTGGLNLSYQAILVPAGSSSNIPFATVASAPLPLPTPNAIPTFANPVYQESANIYGVLPAATQIGVYLNDSASNCAPTLRGTFTTQ